MTDGKPYKPLFISYSNKDKAVAYKVCAILESRGLLCWIAPRDVPPGSNWAEAISDAIDRANALVLIFSEHANKSRAIVSEVDQAFENGIPVFPVRIKNVEPSRELKFRIRTSQWVDAFTPPIEQEINRLADSIHSLLGTQQEDETSYGNRPAGKPVEQVKTSKRKLKWIIAIAAACFVISGLFLFLRSGQKAPTLLPSTQPQSALTTKLDEAGNRRGKEFDEQVEQVQSFRNLTEAAFIYEAKENWEKAIESYQKVLAVKPDDAEAKDKLATCQHNLYLAKGDSSEAAGNLDEAIDNYSKALSYKQITSTQIKLDTAKKAFHDKLESERRQRESNNLIAKAKTKDSKETGKESLQLLEQALKLCPDNAEAIALKKKISGYFGPNAGEIITNTIGMKLVYIPAGEFMMGSPSNDKDSNDWERPQHQAKISKGFWMGVYEITVGHFQRFVDDTGYKTDAEKEGWASAPDGNSWGKVNGANWKNPGFSQTDTHPVVNVSWNDAISFCEWMSRKENKTYRLPTEAEWEYACRAGSTTRFCFGDSDSGLDDYVWYGYDKSGKQTHPVGQKKPNGFGLYDIHGNVWEWCQDWYGESYYSNSPEVDPQGPSSGESHVLRGGSWLSSPRFCRSANRGRNMPDARLYHSGFRVVLESQNSTEQPNANSANALSKSSSPSDSKKVVISSTPATEQTTPQVAQDKHRGDLITNTINMKLAYIPAGEFVMGSPSNEANRNSDEGPQHRVKISREFYMGICEVTQAQYKAVIGSNPSNFKGDNLPVEGVSWNDAVDFCKKLSQKEGKTYRLPTEAEWEYACRAGSTTRFYFGDSDSMLGDYGWYVENFGGQTHPVGQKKPNAFGLYDMQGNVDEWCSDWYLKNYYSQSPEVDPQGPSSGEDRVLRGGSWFGDTEFCRSACRGCVKPVTVSGWVSPVIRLVSKGFRVVMECQAVL